MLSVSRTLQVASRSNRPSHRGPRRHRLRCQKRHSHPRVTRRKGWIQYRPLLWLGQWPLLRTIFHGPPSSLHPGSCSTCSSPDPHCSMRQCKRPTRTVRPREQRIRGCAISAAIRAATTTMPARTACASTVARRCACILDQPPRMHGRLADTRPPRVRCAQHSEWLRGLGPQWRNLVEFLYMRLI